MQEIQETWVQSLGQEDPLEKEMATYSSIPAWYIPWTDEPCRLYSPWGLKESDMTEWVSTHKALNYALSSTALPLANLHCLALFLDVPALAWNTLFFQ